MDLLANIGSRQPQTDPMSPYYDAVNRQKMGRLGNIVGQQLASGSPDKNLMLGELGQVDPLRAMQMAGMDQSKARGARPVTGNMALKIQRQKESEPLKLQANNIANTAVQKLMQDPYADVTAEQLQINNLTSQIQTLGEGYSSPIKAKFDELLKAQGAQLAQTKDVRDQEKFAQSKEEFRYRVSEDSEKDMQEAVKVWKADNKMIVDRAKTVPMLEGFIDEALAGNPVASKNLIAGVSRLGSNEALSDSELNIMLSGNISDQTNQMMEKLFGSGATVGKEDVKNAIATLRGLKPKINSHLNWATVQGLDNLRTTVKGYKDQEIVNLMTSGLKPKMKKVH